MDSYVLRINCNHLRKEINKDYMGIRNHLYLCVLASVCVYNSTRVAVCNLTIEDAYYHRALEHAMASGSIQEAIALLGVVAPPRMFLETHELIEEFLALKYNPAKQSYLSVSIDSGYHLVVNLKVF